MAEDFHDPQNFSMAVVHYGKWQWSRIVLFGCAGLSSGRLQLTDNGICSVTGVTITGNIGIL